MEVDSGQTGAVRFENAFDEILVLYIRETFIVDDHVVSLRPIRIRIDAEPMRRGWVALVHDRPLHVGARGDSFRENLLLLRVVVAAAARDQQGAQGLFGFSRRGRARWPERGYSQGGEQNQDLR